MLQYDSCTSLSKKLIFSSTICKRITIRSDVSMIKNPCPSDSNLLILFIQSALSIFLLGSPIGVGVGIGIGIGIGGFAERDRVRECGRE